MKKGQAALEFLTTYGWAIMIVLVMIGALSYFGVTNPQRYIPDKCLFKVGMGCKDFVVIDAGSNNMQLKFAVENAMGESIELFGASIISNNDNVRYLCSGGGGTYSVGENISFVCPASGTMPSPGVNQGVKFTVNMTYQPVQGSYLRVAEGEISTTVMG